MTGYSLRKTAALLLGGIALCAQAATPDEIPASPRVFTGYEGGEFTLTWKESPVVTGGDLGRLTLPALHRTAELEMEIEEFNRSRAERSRYYLSHPGEIEYLAWLLPQPPEDLKPEKRLIGMFDFVPTNLAGTLGAPEVTSSLDTVTAPKRWLHAFNSSLQFSQAYLSPNWYQGGNNYLSLVGNLYWNVALNTAYYPNLLFNNTVSYKVAVNSTPQDRYHKYSIGEDIFQWNLKFGVKARDKWFYSFTLQFRTGVFNVYPQDSETRASSFLSPGDLNLGLGMSYATANKKETLKFGMSLAPLSYNLKTCIDRKVDPVQFGIDPGSLTKSQIGSSGELTLEWKFCDNVSWRSRLFLFSNYQYFLGDWENTFNFAITRFLSTQIYLHGRYDTSAPANLKGWRHWQFKEILSFGFAYSFATTNL